MATHLPKSASPSEPDWNSIAMEIFNESVMDAEEGEIWQDVPKSVSILKKYFAAEPGRDEREAAKNPEFIELVRGLMKYGLAEDDAKAALLYLFHYGVLQLNSDWTVAARASAAPLPQTLECPKCGWTADEGDGQPVKINPEAVPQPSAGQTEGK